MTPPELECFKGLMARAPVGPRIEFGVFRGDTLALMAKHDNETFGVDSFKGMSAASPRDVKNGWNPYPQGRLACPIDKISKNPLLAGVTLIEGWVPQILGAIPERKFAFAHVDLDQYDSTFAVLIYLAEHMAPGGIICCDDYFAERDWLAAGAINAFKATAWQPFGALGRKAWFEC